LTSLVNERDSLIRGFKKKIEQLEAELEETKRDLVSRSEIELNLQRKLTLLENEYNSIADSSEEKDKVFAAMQKEINEAVNKIDELETTIETLKKQKKEMKEQIELYNLNERDIRTLNVERPNRQDEIVASKRSLTNIYDRNGTELKKQYSTKTLIDDTPTRHIEEMQRLRAELEDAKRQLQYYQDGFMDTKKQSEKLQQLTEEMQLVGANQSAEIHRLNNEVRRKEEYISELSKTLDREKRGARERQESELKS
jgi:chromosome segregation ATPase